MPQHDPPTVGGPVNNESKGKSRGGRPPSYDWDAILDGLMIELGVPDTQNELIELVRKSALAAGQDEPDESTIRSMFGKRFPRFLKAAKAKP